MDCPCDKCTKTDNPKACKRFCDDWKAWFVPRWDRARIAVLLGALNIKEKNDTNKPI